MEKADIAHKGKNRDTTEETSEGESQRNMILTAVEVNTT